MKSNKKAFTVVELVVVIAIIAVLAAVLIPTFANIIKKANISKDTQLIRNLNTALASSRAANNNKPHPTMYDALQAAEAFGYDVGKINASALGNEILWDQENDVFCYLEGDKIQYLPELVDTGKQLAITGDTNNRPYHLWKIFDNLHPYTENDHGFSIYWNGLPIDTLVELDGVGFDAGTASVTNISYTNSNAARDVVIRTNSNLTTLTVNAPKDIVRHYDTAGIVNVISCEMASYHENGIVSFLEVAGGHIVLEETSKVSAVHFTATNGAFKNSDNKTISIDLSKLSKENMPSFTRDTVTIGTNGTFVAEVITDKAEFVWLFGNGIKEQMVVTTQEGAIAENGTLKPGITPGAKAGSVAEQIANPAKRNSEGALVDDNGDEIDVSAVNWSNNNALVDVSEIVYEPIKTKEDAINENVVEVITTFAQLKDFVENGTKINAIIGSDFDITGQIAFDRKIVLDLNGHKLSNITTGSRPFNINAHADVTINGTTAGSEISMPTSNISSYGLFFLNQDCYTLKDTANGIYGPSLILNGGTYSGTTNSGGMIKYKTFVSNIEMYGVTMVSTGGGLLAGDGSMSANYTGPDGYKHKMSYNFATIKDCNFTQGIADNGVNTNVGLSISGVYISNGLIENTTILSAHGNALYLSNGISEVKNCSIIVTNPNPTADWLGSAIGVAADADVTINGGTYQGQQFGLDVYTSNGHVTINNGTFTGTTALNVRNADSYTTTDGFGTPNIKVMNGAFNGSLSKASNTKLEVFGGTFTANPTDYVDTENYQVTGSGPYTVSAK